MKKISIFIFTLSLLFSFFYFQSILAAVNVVDEAALSRAINAVSGETYSGTLIGDSGQNGTDRQYFLFHPEGRSKVKVTISAEPIGDTFMGLQSRIGTLTYDPLSEDKNEKFLSLDVGLKGQFYQNMSLSAGKTNTKTFEFDLRDVRSYANSDPRDTDLIRLYNGDNGDIKYTIKIENIGKPTNLPVKTATSTPKITPTMIHSYCVRLLSTTTTECKTAACLKTLADFNIVNSVYNGTTSLCLASTTISNVDPNRPGFFVRIFRGFVNIVTFKWLRD